MLKRGIAEVAAELANGALQSGQLPLDAKSVASYFRELCDEVAKQYEAACPTIPEGMKREVKRLTEDPNEVD